MALSYGYLGACQPLGLEDLRRSSNASSSSWGSEGVTPSQAAETLGVSRNSETSHPFPCDRFETRRSAAETLGL